MRLRSLPSCGRGIVLYRLVLSQDQGLEVGFTVQVKDAAGLVHTVLEAASRGGHLEVVDRLLTARAIVDAEPSRYSSHTALLLTSQCDHLEVVERLLTGGASVDSNPAPDSGPTAFKAASEGGYLETAKQIQEASNMPAFRRQQSEMHGTLIGRGYLVFGIYRSWVL